MKFNVEIDIEWVGDDDSIDEKVLRTIVNRVSEKVEAKFTDQAKSNIARSAEKLITAKTEQLIYSVLEKPVVISDGWNSTKNYDSIYDMVEQRMTKLYEGKLGSTGKCEKDPLLANIENYIKSQMDSKISSIQRIIETEAKRIATSTLNESKLIDALKKIVPDEKIDEAIMR